jgi:UDP-3-O-[3-hydroxymyristoyl] glucosamine N-acyltransferase
MSGAGLAVAELIRRIAQSTGGSLSANLRGADCRVERTAPLSTAGATDLAFLANSRYRAQAAASAAGAIVLSEKDAAALFGDAAARCALVECSEPYAWFAFAAQLLAPVETLVPAIDPRAQVAAAAQVHSQARIDVGAVIDDGAQIDSNVWIGAGCFVGRDCRIGAGTRLYPGVCLMAGTVLGERCIVHSGAVLGADGFGFAPFQGRWIKIPQTGRVLVGNDVEIGANTTIDRGAMGDTVIEDGVKMDNQIQIGHNCRIGAHSVLAGCVGIAGSAVVGRGVQLGGAAMVLGHLSIADGAVISSGTLVSRTITEAGFYTGFFPLMKNRDWERNAAVLRSLEELRNRVRALESEQRGRQERKDPT